MFLWPLFVCCFEWAGVDTTRWVKLLRGPQKAVYEPVPSAADTGRDTGRDTGAARVPAMYLQS